jgi:hypothetical protein
MKVYCKQFHNNEEVEMAVGEWLRMQEPHFYRDRSRSYGTESCKVNLLTQHFSGSLLHLMVVLFINNEYKV